MKEYTIMHAIITFLETYNNILLGVSLFLVYILLFACFYFLSVNKENK